MVDLPLVLAGPIVRRVEPQSCTFWIALRDAAPQVTATIWPGIQVSTGGGAVASADPNAGTGQAATRQFGKNLHIAVVTVEPATALTPGTVYSYDLQFAGSDLRGEGLLKDETAGSRLPGVDAAAPLHLALGYVEDRLPSFVTAAAIVDRIRLAHGSCRKPHGPGYDALAWLDDRIEDTFADTDHRPQQLFLTGDQIYADDVAACLLDMLSSVAHDVVGAETIRISATDSVDANLINFPPYRRQKTVWDLARFTSDSAASHLLSFGEYAAMYLAAWSSRTWRSLPNAAAVLKAVPAAADSAVTDHLTDWEGCAEKKAIEEKDPSITYASMKTGSYDRQKTAVEVYRDAVPKAARALANCATYMIFDDHEVTDDWNLNKRWQNRAYTRQFGLDVVRNGIMAYAVFQAWGNDPKEFAKTSAADANSNKDLLDETAKVFTGSGPYPHSSAQLGKLDEMAGTAGAPAKKLAKFHYRIDGPVHRVVVLDTRTRRSFKGEGLLPANLLGSTLDQQVPKGPFTDGRQLLVVVSPVPVLGPSLIEAIGQPLAQIYQDFKVRASPLVDDDRDPCEPVPPPTGAEKYDAEAWVGDEVALEKLLQRLAPYEHAVILSGDVHYACSLAMDYWRKDVASPSRIVQLTSSPSRNSFKRFVEALLRSSALLQQYQAGIQPERLAWTGKSSIQLPSGGSVGPGRRSRLNRSPSLVSARTWPAGTTIPADKPPDWRWRLSLERDQRPDTERPTSLRTELLPAELDPSAPLPGYRAIAARHTHAAFTHFDHLRQMVFTPNIGLVDFTGSNGSLQVAHTLLSHDAPDSTTSAPNTIHEIPLTPTTDPPPELVTE